ncbi:hypothetical protein HYW74_03740 [Candidatus Pacearchaeota archaeon]|nr:hypothetical protein [Candidatus Pacearchaeota archaeon]
MVKKKYKFEKYDKSENKKKDIRKKLAIIIGVVAIIFISFLVFNYMQKRLAGQAVLSIQTSYTPNETLKGSLSLSLKKGELIPADSVVRISMGESDYDYQLSNLVSSSTTNGKFYAEGKSLSGEGSGFGVAGEKEIYPEVSFAMKVNKISEKDKDKDKEKKGETNGTSPETTTTSETNTETQTEATTTTETIDTGSGSASESKNEEEGKSEEKKEEKSETKQNKESEAAGITGGVVAELSVEVEGKTSKNTPYTYALAEGETAEIISSSQTVSLILNNGVVTVITNYSEKQNGFGQEYLGETAYTLGIELSSLNLIAQEGRLKVSLISGSEEITSVTTNLNVETPEQTATSESETLGEAEENQTLQNAATNMTSNLTSNITKSVSVVIENLSDYVLTDDELFKLKAATRASEVKITKSEVVNGRLILRFQLGNYWLEKSYDYSNNNSTILNEQIELDRVKWVKNLAKKLSETSSSKENIEEFIGNYSLS